MSGCRSERAGWTRDIPCRWEIASSLREFERVVSVGEADRKGRETDQSCLVVTAMWAVMRGNYQGRRWNLRKERIEDGGRRGRAKRPTYL